MLAAHSLLEREPGAGRDQIIEGLAGHMCRCTGYVKIVEAVEAAARGDVDTTPRPGGRDPRGREPGMKAVGARLPRYDGLAQVTGRIAYVDDVRVPGTLWAKALRSPHHFAGITKLDTGKAEAIPGVHAVITKEDVPLNVYGHLSGLGVPGDEPLLAEDEVRYKGQPIAVVAAETEELARAGVEAIEIDLRGARADLRHAQGLRSRVAADPPVGAGLQPLRPARPPARPQGRRRQPRSSRPTRSSRASTARRRSSTARSSRRPPSPCRRPTGG